MKHHIIMAKERYDEQDTSFTEADHKYFDAYANWILPRIPAGKILDIGCGLGYLTRAIAELPQVELVVAVDKHKPARENLHPKIIYITQNLPTDLTLLGKFEGCVSTEFIEHVTEDDLKTILENLHPVITQGGRFLGSTPDVTQHSGNPFHLREYQLPDLKNLFHAHHYEGDYATPAATLCTWDVGH